MLNEASKNFRHETKGILKKDNELSGLSGLTYFDVNKIIYLLADPSLSLNNLLFTVLTHLPTYLSILLPSPFLLYIHTYIHTTKNKQINETLVIRILIHAY